jgi:hypothetical protein
MRRIIFLLIVFLTFLCHSSFYAQEKSKTQKRKEQRQRIKENSKGLSLKVKDLKAVEKSGITVWNMKTVLSNHSKDTLFYFSWPNCDASNFMLYTEELIIYFDPCDTSAQAVIAIPPREERTVDLEIRSVIPGTVEHMSSTVKFKVIFWLFKAKNKNERIPIHDLLMNYRDREGFVWSNELKITRTNSSGGEVLLGK